nr:O-antigen ligase family protein [Thalassobacillus sp. CUG 92003]
MIKRKNLVNWIIILCFIFALMLSGKRIFIIANLASLIIVYWFFYTNHSFLKKTMLSTFFTIMMIILIIIYSEDIINFFELNANNFASGRFELYLYAWELFTQKPFLGWGINSFAELSFDNVFAGRGIDVHNVYLQLLTEMGIFGAFIITFVLISTLIYTIYLNFQNNGNSSEIIEVLQVSTYMQSLFLFYSVTGNPFYNYNFLMIYLMFVAPLYIVQLKLKNKPQNNNFIKDETYD